MARTRVLCFGMSLDGYSAGLHQDLQNPLGQRGTELMDWLFATRTWHQQHQLPGGETGVDDRKAAQGFEGVGAWILGRNMFGPVRGPWPDDSWKGWWGDDFHFVTDGIHAALDRAKEAAGGRDVRIGGGVSTIRQYLQYGLIDEISLAVRPILLGAGEPLLAGLDIRALGYECVEHTAGERATHVVIRKKPADA